MATAQPRDGGHAGTVRLGRRVGWGGGGDTFTIVGDAPSIGVDLGATHFHVGLVSCAGVVLARNFGLTRREDDPARIIERLAACVRATCADAGVRPDAVSGVGIGAPGSIDFARGVVLEAPNLGWKGVPLAPMLAACLGGVRTVIDNDVNCAVLGENTLGAGANAKDALGVWVGTGVGGGIVLDHEVYRGPLGTAGEIGRTVLFPDAPPGARLMEEHCSRAGVARTVARARSLSDEPAADEIARWYAQGDAEVVAIVDRAADLLGVSIANTLSIMSIPLVLLGGGLAEAMGEPYRARIERAVRADVFPGRPLGDAEVRLTTLRENAGLLGAAMLAR